MQDYGKKTVAELQEILKGRSLPHTGKKADLVTRLSEADKPIEAATTATEPIPQTEVAEPVVEETAPASESVPVNEEPKDAVATDATADEASLKPPQPIQPEREGSATTDAKLATAVDYSLGLDKSSLESELKKRKARAERFGAPTEEIDEQAQKAAERAKKFGTGDDGAGVSKLDEALPLERERRAKRARNGENGLEDTGLRQGRGGKRRFQGRGGRNERQGGRPTGVRKSGGKSTPGFSSEKDRLAAEARKKKFGTG